MQEWLHRTALAVSLSVTPLLGGCGERETAGDGRDEPGSLWETGDPTADLSGLEGEGRSAFEEGIATVRSLPESVPFEEKIALLEPSVRAWLNEDRWGAAEAIAALVDEPGLLRNLGGTVLEALERESYSGAFYWAATIQEPYLALKFQSEAAARWVRSEPEEAVAAVATLTPDGRPRDPRVIGAVAMEIPVPDLRAFLTRVPPGWLSPDALRDISGRWNREDPGGFLEWLFGNEEAVLNGVTAAVVDSLIEDDPVAAFAWSAAIADRESRRRYLRDTYAKAAAADKEGAAAVLREGGLSVDDLTAIDGEAGER